MLAYLWSKEVEQFYDIYLSLHKRKINYFQYKFLDINLNSQASLAKALNENNIDIVLNTIGMTNIEECEFNPDLAFKINAHLAGKVANVCRKYNKKLIHISTDHFFDNSDKLHTEEDDVELLNIYAKSKFEGELNVLENFPSALICRTNFFGFGPPHKESMSDWIINSIKNQKEITLFNDVTFTPVEGRLLAKNVHHLLNLGGKGVYNFSSDKKITKYAFGINLCRVLDLPTDMIKSTSILERLDLVKRPLSMGLSNKKFVKKVNSSIGSVEKHLQKLKDNC